VKLIFLRLAHVEEAIARVAQGVRQGGHHVPSDVIARRFEAGLRNFETLYAPAVDACALYDNSGDEPVLIDWSEKR
jgi:predicted ABC-type ATPase